jgi:predicted MFS family arabinose efflux permease
MERNHAQRRSVVLVATATAFSLLGDQALYAVLPVYYEALGIAALEVGVLLSANRWIRLLTNGLAHRFATGSVRDGALFAVALTVGVLTTVAYAVTSAFALLLVARLAWGLAWSFIRHLGVAAIMRGTGSERPGRTMGTYNGISRAGSVAGLLGGALLVDLLGFRDGMLALAVLSLVSVPLGIAGYRRGASLPGAPSAADRLPLALGLGGLAVGSVGPGFVMSTLGAALVGYGAGAPLIGDGQGADSWGLTAATLSGLLLGARYAMDALAAPWLGGLADRDAYRASAGYFLIGGLALLVAATKPPLPVFMVLVLAFFICGTGLQAGLAGTARRYGSGAFARYVTLSDLGSALGPIIGWSVVAWLNDPLPVLALGGVVYLAVVIGIGKKTWQG